MLDFLAEYGATLMIAALVAAGVVLAVVYTVKNKKHCCGFCSECSGCKGKNKGDLK